MITTILWDLDNTLLDFAYSQRIALGKTFLAYGMTMTEEILKRYDEINEGYWKRLERGEVTKDELIPGRFIDLFKELGVEGIPILDFAHKYGEELGLAYAYVENSYELVKRFQGRFHQYIVTNGVTKTQETKIALAGFSELMDGVFISEAVGANKPSLAFFKTVAEHLSEKDLSRILIVGDSLTSDIKGGKDFGIRTCWYNPRRADTPNDVSPDYIIYSLNELQSFLD